MSGMNVLVVDDETAVRESLRHALELEGYDVDLAPDGGRALAHIEASIPDAVILDVLMPGVGGLEVARRLRAGGNRVPILMLTARAEVDDRVAGLDAGADDYLVKPFALDELNARVRALLRRAGGDEHDERLSYLDLTLDLAGARAHRGDRLLELTRTEQRLLELLLRNPDQVLPRDMIYERVWGHDISQTSNSLDVYVGYLRRKTEEGGEPRLIHTVRGVGFRLTD